jgi:hypothetical protein
MDIPNWLMAVGAIGGSTIGAYTAVRVTIATLIEKARTLEKSVDELREWKHEVVDPYIPRAVDEHERRLNKLDSRVFNGP